MEQKGPAGRWGAQEDARRPVILQVRANGFHQSSPLCRTRPRRDWQPKAGEVSSQLPFSRNPLWWMLQLRLWPGAEVCRRRSRRWPEKITEAKAVRE